MPTLYHYCVSEVVLGMPLEAASVRCAPVELVVGGWWGRHLCYCPPLMLGVGWVVDGDEPSLGRIEGCRGGGWKNYGVRVEVYALKAGEV